MASEHDSRRTDAAPAHAGAAADDEAAPPRAQLAQLQQTAGDLRARLAWYEELLQNLNEVIFTVGADGTMVYVSPAIEAVMGYRPDEVVGRSFLEFIHEQDRARLTDDFDAIFAGTLYPSEYRLLRKSGEVAWVRSNSRPVLDSSGVPVALQGTLVEITQRKQAEQALQDSEAKYRLLTENQRDVVIALSPAGELLYCSPAVAELGGYDPEQELGHPIDRYVAEQDRERVRGALMEMVVTREPASLELLFQPREGEPFPIEASARIVERDGELVALHCILRDIRERRRVEGERAALEQQLLHAQKMEAIGRLAGGVAHDFNNILTGIGGYAALVLDRLDPSDPLHADVAEIERASERASRLTSQLLAFSRKQLIDPRVVDLNEAIDHARRMLTRIIGEDVDLEFRPGRELWRVEIDLGQLDQVLVNLATNSRDAMPGGGHLLVQTRNEHLDSARRGPWGEVPAGDYVALEVSDQGAGIDAEHLRHVFEPFFSTKAKGKGTGLGLSTVYGIVTQNGGFIEVASAPGQGTTFSILLPRAVASGTSRPEAGAEDALPRGDERVLLVEDEEMVRRLARRMLERQGYTVVEARDGRDALARCSGRAPEIQLLLTDVVMPGMNGKELYRELCRRRPGLRVLYMSGYSEDVVAHHGVLDEGTLLVQKPFTVRTLAQMVRRALDR